MHINKIIIALALVISLIIQGFRTSSIVNPSDQIRTAYHQDMELLQADLSDYVQIAHDLTNQPESIQKLQEVHRRARLDYKKFEYLIEYYDSYGVKQNLNGAPLPKTEPKVADLNIIQPKGLQTLDELVFDEDPYSTKTEILGLIKKLSKAFDNMKNYQKGIAIEDRHVFEAMRLEVIRIIALGITGFDTPGSVNALPEAQVALQGLGKTLTYYESGLNQNNPKVYADLTTLIDIGIDYLNNNTDFDTFNRMHFIREVMNPLYGKLLKAHKALGIETVYETTNLTQAVNYYTESIFSDDFLNKEYFSSLRFDSLSPYRTELGKLLFYDPILSSDLKMSCSSCHQPNKAFTDGLAKSIANDGNTVKRNAPTLINAVYAEKYFLDLREEFFERQMNHVITHHQEFDSDFIKIMDKLEQSSAYIALIDQAYPDEGLSPHAITNSISHYVSSLISMDSPFDQYMNQEVDDYSESAINGFNIFMGKAACGTCHFVPTFAGLVPPNFIESESEVLGVTTSSDFDNPVLDYDLGRFANAKPLDEADIYAHAFKTTTVRNSEHTAPYMHNGAYSSYEELMEFYNNGGGAGMGLNVPNQTLAPDPLNLTDDEITDIIAFMKTLSDLPEQSDAPSLPKFDKKPEWNQRVVSSAY